MLLFIICSHVYMEIGVVVAGEKIDVATVIPEQYTLKKLWQDVKDSHTETETESSASTNDSEKSYADITRILNLTLTFKTHSKS